MVGEKNIKRTWLKRLLIIGTILFIVGGTAIWYIFTQKFEDTTKQQAAYTVNAVDFIKEFQASDSLANKKYAEKIITINGRVSEMEAADTTINIKMIDTLTDAYIIFAFQKENIMDVKKIKEGDSISVKGSCSGGTYSDILETEFINFKRCIINK
jgi:tRNA_anti-like